MANTLAKTRERRSNAGSRMAQMLDKEEDDFYKSTYGGFFEEEDDQVYVSEDSESDNVDSDFDIDERDEVIEQEEDEGDKRKKRTKAFREPVRKVVERKSVVSSHFNCFSYHSLFQLDKAFSFFSLRKSRLSQKKGQLLFANRN